MFKALDQELLKIRTAGLERRVPYSAYRGSGKVDISGKSLIDFASFDVLGLSTNKRVIRASQKALQLNGISQPAPRTVGGTLPELFSAEKRLAAFLGVESALFFSSRNQALLSLMSALVSEGDTVAFDETNQAPMTDVCHLLNGVPGVFSQDRLDSIDSLLDRASYVPVCLYCEGLSPLTGEVFPFERLSPKIAVDKKVHLVVDESYALGIVGNRGSGAFEKASAVFPYVSFVGSFGLGCPGYGGFVAGQEVVIEYLRQTSRAFDVESPIPSYIAAAIEESLDILELQIHDRKKVCEKARWFAQQVKLADVEAVGGESSPIVGVSVPSFRIGREIVTRLEAKGMLVELVGARSLRRERALLRAVFNVFHSQADIDQLLDVVTESLANVS